MKMFVDKNVETDPEIVKQFLEVDRISSEFEIRDF